MYDDAYSFLTRLYSQQPWPPKTVKSWKGFEWEGTALFHELDDPDESLEVVIWFTGKTSMGPSLVSYASTLLGSICGLEMVWKQAMMGSSSRNLAYWYHTTILTLGRTTKSGLVHLTHTLWACMELFLATQDVDDDDVLRRYQRAILLVGLVPPKQPVAKLEVDHMLYQTTVKASSPRTTQETWESLMS